jgi:hypothetical protein
MTTPSELLTAVCAAKAGRVQGTAFLVSPQLAVTCAHVVGQVDDDAEVTLKFAFGELAARVERLDKEADWAVLRLSNPAGETRPLPLSTTIASGDRWRAYGFAGSARRSGAWIEGMVRGDSVTNDRQGAVITLERARGFAMEAHLTKLPRASPGHPYS